MQTESSCKQVNKTCKYRRVPMYIVFWRSKNKTCSGYLRRSFKKNKWKTYTQPDIYSAKSDINFENFYTNFVKPDINLSYSYSVLQYHRFLFFKTDILLTWKFNKMVNTFTVRIVGILLIIYCYAKELLSLYYTILIIY